MIIKQNLCPSSKYSIKCPYSMKPIGICIHNTANDASAKNEVSYMIGNGSKVSFHYAVDNIEIVQGIPNERNAWHAGDGGGGTGNRKYISIEICYSKSGGSRFEAAMKNAAWLTAKLLRKYGWGIGCVKKHQDFSGKYCPHRILDDYGWDYFLDLVRAELGESFNSDEEKPIMKEVKQMAKFPDTEGHWAEKTIDELAEMGIAHGDGNGNFRPDDKITRAEAATLVRNAVKYVTGK